MSNPSVDRCHVCLEKLLDAILLDECCHCVCRVHVESAKKTNCQVDLKCNTKCSSKCNLDEWRTKRLPTAPAEFICSQESQQAIVNCQECQDDEIQSQATCRCIECEKVLCEPHKQLHSKRLRTQKHQIEVIEEASAIQNESKCPIHTNEELKAL